MNIFMLAVLLIGHGELEKIAEWRSHQWRAAVVIDVRPLWPREKTRFQMARKTALTFRVWGINTGKKVKSTEWVQLTVVQRYLMSSMKILGKI